MDKLEEFVKAHRADFEEPRDPKAGWEVLEGRLEAANTHTTSWMWKAAAVIFLVSTLSVLAWKVPQSNPRSMAVEQSTGLEGYYMELISYKQAEYQQVASPQQQEEFLNDLKTLDDAYRELKSSFDETNSEEIASAMVENLRLRVQLLNEQIEILQRSDEILVESSGFEET